MIGNWNYPTPIRFGAGRIAELPDACRELGMKRPLLVTDPGLAALPIVSEALQINDAADLPTALFSAVTANPTGADVTAGLSVFRSEGCDGVIAFGGGSALDVGKAVGLMAHQTRPLWDFEDIGDYWTRVDTDAMAPVVAVPTTSGTGSEVGRCSVIVDTETHTKKIIFHPGMLPGRVVADPGLTVGLPAHITAAVGMDALSHNLEALCAPGFHPMAAGIAVEGIRLIANSLRRAVADGTDIDARSEMMVASTMGATAFQRGLGAMHALSHPVGAVIGAHHGLTNAVVMPYVLVFNRPAIQEGMTDLARAMNLPNPSFDSVLSWVLSLREDLGIPNDLGALGVREDQIDRLAPMAAADPTAATNPIPLNPVNLGQLYRQATRGSL